MFSDLTPEQSFEDQAAQSSYGDYMTEGMEPISQISGTYGFFNGSEKFEAGTGAATIVDGMFNLAIGTGVGDYAVARTTRPTVFRQGQGIVARLSGIFDGNAVASSLQFAGLFSLTDTVALGYDGATFSVIYQSYGKPEVRSLQVTTAGNGTITLTLNGVGYSIPVTTGTVEHNCYEIEAWMNDTANQSIWSAQQVDDTVIFQARDTSARSGSYSVSGAGIAGTITQVEAGAAKTNAHVARTSWDNNPTWFDPTKSNEYEIKMSGSFGPMKFFIMNRDSQRYELVHTIKPLGVATKPAISKRAMKAGWTCASLGSTTALAVQGAEASTFVEGDSKVLGQSKTIENKNVSVGASYVAVLTIRALNVFFSKVNLGRVVPVNASVSNDATKPVEYIVVKNAILGETDYTYVSEDNSIVTWDGGAHAYSGEVGSEGGELSAGGSDRAPLTDLDVELLLGDTLTVFARKTSGTNPTVTARVTWKEDI